MKVKLKSSRAGHLIGERIPPTGERAVAIRDGKEIEQPEYRLLGSYAQEINEVVDVPDAEAGRMIQAGVAVAVK